MKKENKNYHISIVVMIIILGVFSCSCKVIYNQAIKQLEKEKINEFFQINNQAIMEQPISTETPINSIDDTETKIKNNKEFYIAILEIPNISLKKGIYDRNSKNNNVNKNIEILKESNMPDVQNGDFILAGHSGTGKVAYFSNLEKLKLEDTILVYYQGIKYSYKIVNIHLEQKDGTISISNQKEVSRIILTTCSQQQKGKQLVIVGNLILKEKY